MIIITDRTGRHSVGQLARRIESLELANESRQKASTELAREIETSETRL